MNAPVAPPLHLRCYMGKRMLLYRSFLVVWFVFSVVRVQAGLTNGPTWTVTGAVISFPFIENAAGEVPFNAIRIAEINLHHFEGTLSVGNLNSGGYFVPVENDVTFKFTALDYEPAIQFTAKNRALYIDQRLRTFLIPMTRSDLRQIGVASVVNREDQYFLRSAIAQIDRYPRVDSGPLGQAVVHGYFLKLAQPLSFFGGEFSVLRFIDSTDQGKGGQVDFGNVDHDGRWIPGRFSSVWRYGDLGVLIGGRRGSPSFEIRNGTSAILEPNIPVSILTIIDRQLSYRAPITGNIIMPLCMGLFRAY